jgi:hypothetical protein
MGFTPIYEDLRMLWNTLTYDENVSSSRRLIYDTQYMTFWNFVIDAVLWQNFDDPWRKSTVMDHRIFCSVMSQVGECPRLVMENPLPPHLGTRLTGPIADKCLVH